MNKVYCPYCSGKIIEDTNKIIDLERLKLFQCPFCYRVMGNPFYKKQEIKV